MKANKKLVTGIISIMLCAVLCFGFIITRTDTIGVETLSAATRTVELSTSATDYQSVLNEFEDSKLTKEGTTTYFEGTKTLDLNLFSEIDNTSDNWSSLEGKCKVKYYFLYNSETNIVTLQAIMANEYGIIDTDIVSGIAFTNEYGEIDALMDMDGEYILLSEMQNLGLIENCGWFKSLVSKIVVAVVVVVAVAAVAATVVATAGAGLGACIAAGAIAGGITGAVSGGLISYSEYGKLDWKWVVGGAVIGAAIGAVTGWGVGSVVMKTPTAQTNRLIKSAKNGKLDFSESIKNKSYYIKGNKDYRQYYEQTNMISQEIMKAKEPIVEAKTNYLKWTVEGVQQTVKGTTYGHWELIIDPVKEIIVHFLFAS